MDIPEKCLYGCMYGCTSLILDIHIMVIDTYQIKVSADQYHMAIL